MTSGSLTSRVVLVAGALAIAVCGKDSAPTNLKTTFGQISGLRANGVYSWLGLQYGKAARWQAPADPDSWTGTKALDTLAPACAQVGQTHVS